MPTLFKIFCMVILYPTVEQFGSIVHVPHAVEMLIAPRRTLTRFIRDRVVHEKVIAVRIMENRFVPSTGH